MSLHRTNILAIGLAVIGIFLSLYVVFTGASIETLLALLCIVIFAAIAFVDAWWALLGLLVIRPIADAFGARVLVDVGGLSLNLASVLSLGVIIWGVFILLQCRKELRHHPLIWPLILFMLTNVASLLWTITVASTMEEVFRIGAFVLLCAVSYVELDSRKKVVQLLFVVASSLIIPGLFSAVQFITHSGLSFGELSNRVFGTFAHPNVLAFYLVISIALLFGVSARVRRKVPALLFWLGWAAILCCLLATYTRGAWLGAMIVVMVFGFVRYRRESLGVILAGVLLVLSAPLVNKASIAVFHFDIAQTSIVQRVIGQSEDSSIDWRFQLWKEMSAKISEQPVIGHGLGAFPILRERQNQYFFQGTEAHNDYLRLAVETGILGLAAYAMLLFMTFISLLRSYRNTHDTLFCVVLLGVLAATCALVVMSVFDNLLQATPVMWLYWVSVGIALKMPRLKT